MPPKNTDPVTPSRDAEIVLTPETWAKTKSTPAWQLAMLRHQLLQRGHTGMLSEVAFDAACERAANHEVK